MAIARNTLTTNAKQIAQDPSSGATILLASGDYDRAIDQALELFRTDRPNVRVYHYTVAASAFRFVLAGTGLILPSSGLDRWVDGASDLLKVWHPYDTTAMDNQPLDGNDWAVVREPGPLVVLILRDYRPSSGVLRLEYRTPHEVHATDSAQSSILAGDVKALELLTAVKLCEMAATRYAQNTGSSAFQSESVDRRTQSDIMASRAKDLMKSYNAIVGKGGGGEVAGAAAVKKLEIQPTHGRGRLWIR